MTQQLGTWNVYDPLRYPIPNPSGQSGWERCHKRVREYDEDMCKALKDEIDKLLILAGLFSAAVTAFVVQSYQWLENSGDPSANILAQFIAIHVNGTVTLQHSPVTTISTTTSAVRINICWFISLGLSLSSVFVGILCLQWLREYERPVATSLESKLRYRQIRFEGLIDWKVPEIIATLPLFLEVALILFFVGVINLLWARSHAVAIAVLVPISLTISFLLATTLISIVQSLQIRLNIHCLSQMTQCPYKSPLSWTIYRLISPLLDMAWYYKDSLKSWKQSRNSPFKSLGSQFDHPWLEYEFIEGCHSIFPATVKALRWIQNELRRETLIIAPIHDCLHAMDEQTMEYLALSVTENCEKKLNIQGSPTWTMKMIREVACIIELNTSLILSHHITLVEHSIRLSWEGPRFLAFIPPHWWDGLPDAV